MIPQLLTALRAVMAPVAILITAAILVIALGPGAGMKSPWHYVVAGVLVLLALIVYVIWWWMQRRLERQFESGIMGQAQEDMSRASVARRAEMEALAGRWKESIDLLRRSNPKGGNVLQVLPWFVIIGEPGSGKSTLLKNSGLDFPIGDARIAGIGGTKNCDWWFANECIVLDTAGRYAFEVQNAPDRAEWDRFLGLLKKTRKRNTINGLLVTVPTDSLLQKEEDELRSYAQHLRGKLNDLITRLGIVFPVYLVVTKVDLVEGFVDFFQRYPTNRVREAVGRTFSDIRPSQGLVDAGKTLDDLYDRLCSMSLGMMEQEEPGAPGRPYLVFPEEYRTLAGKLKVFLHDLFRENIYMRNPLFRGLYLTSGTQEGRSIATVIDDVARKLGLSSEAATTSTEDRPKRTYFVRDLLSSLLIQDAVRDLVRPAEKGGGRVVAQALWKVVLPTAAVAALLIGWGTAGYLSNRTSWRVLTEKVRGSASWAPPAGPVQPAGVSAAIDELASIRGLRDAAMDCSPFLSLFLCRSDPDPGQFHRAFARAVEGHVLKPTLERLQQRLHGRPSDIVPYLQDLDVYLAYRRAVREHRVADPAKIEALADVWSRDPSGAEVASRKAPLASLVAAYVEMGGGDPGGSAFEQVASRIEEVNRSFSRTDPGTQLTQLGREAGPVVLSNSDSASIWRLWDELRRIEASLSGGVKVPADLLQRVQASVRDEPAAAAVGEPLGRLAALASGGVASGGAEGDVKALFDQHVRKPLHDAVTVPKPRCPVLAPPNADSAKEVVAVLDGYAKELGAKADALKAGIEALNGARAGADPIPAAAVSGLVVPANVGALFQECSRGWFEVEGPLSTSFLRRAFGAGGGGGGPAPDIGPPGNGLFQCLYPIPGSGGGAQADPALVAGFDAAIRGILAVREVPGDLRASVADQWTGSAASLRGGRGGGDWEPAISRIRLNTPASEWDLADVPDMLRQDGSLRAIWGQIRDGLVKGGGGSSTAAAAKAFTVDGYVTELANIGNRLGAALEDPSGFGLIGMYAEMARAPSGRTPFERALAAVRGAPPPAFKKELESVPREVFRKVVGAAQTQLEEFYAREVRSQAAAIAECFPFSEGGADCRAEDFEALFGPKGRLAKIAPFGEDAPVGAESRFGTALRVGEAFQRFARSAAVIHRAYAEGAAGDQGGFRLTFEAQLGEVRPVGKVKADELLLQAESAVLSFGAASRAQVGRAEGTATQRVSVPVDDAARSRVTATFGARGEAGLMSKIGKDPFSPANTDLGEVPQASGPWSFLRLMMKGRSEMAGGCCAWDLPILEKDKKGQKGEVVAEVTVTFALVPPRGGRGVLDREFWTLETPPGSVRD